MATFVEFLHYKRSLPWYKRICFSLLLSQKDIEEALRLKQLTIDNNESKGIS